MELRPIAASVRAVRPHLPDAAFAPAPSRLVWLPFHAAVIGTLAWALASGRLRRILERFEPPAGPVSVVHAEGRAPRPKVRAFVALLVATLRPQLAG